jgi:DNA-binding response OmpR family regulator
MALELLEEADGLNHPLYDRVIIACRLSYIDGFELLNWIRGHDQTKNTWVALMVSRLQDCDEPEHMSVHPDKYLLKPFDPREVM